MRHLTGTNQHTARSQTTATCARGKAASALPLSIARRRTALLLLTVGIVFAAGAFADDGLLSPSRCSAQEKPNGDPEKIPPVLHFVPRVGEGLEQAVIDVVRDARKRPPDAEYLIPEMATLYRELGIDETLPRHKREEYQAKLEFYLIDLGLFVIDDFKRQERRRAREAAAQGLPKNGDSLGQQLLNGGEGGQGGATQAAAQDLIDLITSTIAPETWDINGGIGSIRYYSLMPALVVRQTGTNLNDLNRLLIGLR